jgi:transcriptional regulator with GAF, ATPase, and Fis domain
MADEGLSLQESKRRLLHTFEHDYLTRVLTESHGNVTQAALRAKKERRELGKLLRKHGLNAKDFARAV